MGAAWSSHRALVPKPAVAALKQGAAARLAAADLLERVIDHRTGLDALTDPREGRAPYLALSERDRSLARAIATVALRRRGPIERGLARFLDRPLPRKARHLAHLLHVAGAQIAFMEVADRAAIDLAVEAAKHDGRSRRFAPLVNAVLRRFAEAKGDVVEASLDPADVPSWLWKGWRSDYGRDNALSIVASLRDEPLLDLTLKNEAVEHPEGERLPNGTLRVAARTAVPELPGYGSGGWWVQDAAASLPALLLGDVRGLRVLDMCAAPGGKTAQLAARGARVTAWDRAPERVERLRLNLARLGLHADCRVADALEHEATEPFDAVLLDAPCSSLGTLRRHPDVVWTKTAADVEALALLQARLLERAIALVRPGGRVVFANCSLMKREGEAVWQPLRERDDVAPDPIQPEEVFGLPALSGQGTLRTLPFHRFGAESGGMDGFFAGRLRRA